MNKLVLVLAALLAVTAAGCGEGSSPGAEGAGIAPAGSLVFVSLDTSFDSGSWDDARALLDKFPDGRTALDGALGQLDDVEPALGPETNLVALDLRGNGKVVGLTQPDDRAKLDALLGKSNEQLVSREIAGWVAFSDSEANLDEFEQLRADGTLEDEDAYRKVAGEVGADALAQVYVAGSALAATPLAGVIGPDAPSLAFSLDPKEDGIEVEGAASPATSELFSDEFAAELPDEVPAGAYLYAGTSDLEGQLGALRDVLAETAPDAERDLGRAEAGLGVSLDEDVFPLFAAESALYVRPGLPIPEVTIVTRVEDEQGAVAVLDKLARAVQKHAGGAALRTVDVGGVQAKALAVNQFVSIYYAAFDGKLVVTTSQQGIADLRSSSERLADEPAYEGAIDAAGMPDETTGFVYVDLEQAVSTVLGLASFSGQNAPDALARNLKPLDSLVLWGERDGDLARFHGSLSVQ